jgi:hypothetical protein
VTAAPDANAAPDAVAEALARGVAVMAEHALRSGRQVDAGWLEVARQAGERPPSPDGLRRLARCHDELVALVAPATPRSLLYLRTRRHVRLVRWLAAFGIVMLVGFVGFATDPDVGAKAADFETGFGHELFVNLLFQLCAAGLGATFAALFAVSGRLRDASLDERDEFATGVRIMLGLVSGLVLAQLVPFDERSFGRPLLALLGGFSVDVVYQILKRLVEVASSLVSPTGDPVAAERERAQAREAQLKAQIAHRLERLRASLPADATAEVDALIEELAPSAAPTTPARRPGPA